MIKLVLATTLMALGTASLFGQMTDAKFLGLKGKVRSVFTERTFRFSKAKQRLNQAELVKSNYYDKKGYLTSSSTFDGGESRRNHSFSGSNRRVDRFEFDASGKSIAMTSSCPSTDLLREGKPVGPHFDYFYQYQRDSRKRIIGVTEFCVGSAILTKSVFKYNDKNRVVSDVRCQPQTDVCDNNYYEYADRRLTRHKVATSVNGVERCVSETTYTGHQVDKKGNEIRRVGETTDCSNNKVVFYRFIDTMRILYY